VKKNNINKIKMLENLPNELQNLILEYALPYFFPQGLRKRKRVLTFFILLRLINPSALCYYWDVHIYQGNVYLTRNYIVDYLWRHFSFIFEYQNNEMLKMLRIIMGHSKKTKFQIPYFLEDQYYFESDCPIKNSIYLHYNPLVYQMMHELIGHRLNFCNY